MDEDERRREMVNEAMHVGTARIPSWATDGRRATRTSMAFVYLLAFLGAMDILTPIPGLLGIALAVWHLRHHHKGASIALVVAIAATVVGVLRYLSFLHG